MMMSLVEWNSNAPARGFTSCEALSRIFLILNVARPKRVPQPRYPRNRAAPPESPLLQHYEAPKLGKDFGAIKTTSAEVLVHAPSKSYPTYSKQAPS